MVDDNDTDAYLAQRCYERSGLENEFVHIRSGEDLIDHLGKVEAGDENMPGLVLLDVNMPVMSGFEALSEIRARPGFRDVPVIAMLSTSDDERDVQESLNRGANAFFTKPSDIGHFVELFRSLSG